MKLAGLASAAILLSTLAGTAQAGAVFDFAFNEGPGVLDGQGSFTVGAASTQDAGYFLLTSLTFTSLRDTSGTLDTGTLTETVFNPGAAYDPTTEAFINHFNGGTYDNVGAGFAAGSTGPNNFGYSPGPGAHTYIDPNSFVQGADYNSLSVYNAYNGLAVDDYDLLTITPETPTSVPEPATAALLAAGLLGLAYARSRKPG